MPIYNVFLVNIAPTIGRSIDTRGIAQKLEGLFRRVIRHGGTGFSDAHVEWQTNCPSLQPWELVIYFVPNQFEDIVSRVGGQFRFDPTLAGFTLIGNAPGQRHASEVFRDSGNAVFLAKTAFHESMHNKLRLSDPQLHSHNGLAMASINDATPLTQSNINMMAPALRVHQPQWCLGQRDWRAMDSDVIPDLQNVP
jgi:hypothetical protein